MGWLLWKKSKWTNFIYNHFLDFFRMVINLFNSGLYDNSQSSNFIHGLQTFGGYLLSSGKELWFTGTILTQISWKHACFNWNYNHLSTVFFQKNKIIFKLPWQSFYIWLHFLLTFIIDHILWTLLFSAMMCFSFYFLDCWHQKIVREVILSDYSQNIFLQNFSKLLQNHNISTNPAMFVSSLRGSFDYVSPLNLQFSSRSSMPG